MEGTVVLSVENVLESWWFLLMRAGLHVVGLSGRGKFRKVQKLRILREIHVCCHAKTSRPVDKLGDYLACGKEFLFSPQNLSLKNALHPPVLQNKSLFTTVLRSDLL
jgi:hypothetical protein